MRARQVRRSQEETRNVLEIATVSKIGIGVMLMEWEWGMTAESPPLTLSRISWSAKAVPSDAQAKNPLWKVSAAIPKRK